MPNDTETVGILLNFSVFKILINLIASHNGESESGTTPVSKSLTSRSQENALAKMSDNAAGD